MRCKRDENYVNLKEGLKFLGRQVRFFLANSLYFLIKLRFPKLQFYQIFICQVELYNLMAGNDDHHCVMFLWLFLWNVQVKQYHARSLGFSR